MERILPIDLERAKLRTSLAGYSKHQVDQLLHGAADSMRQLLHENDRLRSEQDIAHAEVERYRLQEDTLKETLVMAQRAADETRVAAQRTAESMIETARQSVQSDQLARKQELSDLEYRIAELRRDRQRFQDELVAMLDRYRREVEGVPTLIVLDAEQAMSVQ